jgi:hypothetical protein
MAMNWLFSGQLFVFFKIENYSYTPKLTLWFFWEWWLWILRIAFITARVCCNVQWFFIWCQFFDWLCMHTSKRGQIVTHSTLAPTLKFFNLWYRPSNLNQQTFLKLKNWKRTSTEPAGLSWKFMIRWGFWSNTRNWNWKIKEPTTIGCKPELDQMDRQSWSMASNFSFQKVYFNFRFIK